jgi:hypothetical protein
VGVMRHVTNCSVRSCHSSDYKEHAVIPGNKLSNKDDFYLQFCHLNPVRVSVFVCIVSVFISVFLCV